LSPTNDKQNHDHSLLVNIEGEAMNENRRKILEMLSAGKITAAEAERLMDALEKEAHPAAQTNADEARPQGRPKYLRVSVEDNGCQHANVRVPLQLLRAGVKLASLIPERARQPFVTALRANGTVIGVGALKPENIEELLTELDGLSIDVDGEENPNKKTRVRVYCE
jgi:polyhydroxyalkanoate synthesis regulator phasin